MSINRNCESCVWAWLNGTGYSDYTWMDTTARCFQGRVAFKDNDIPEEGKPWPAGEFAKQCDAYREDSDPMPVISPDGEFGKDARRFSELIRIASKG